MSKFYKAAKRIVRIFLAIVSFVILSSCDMHDDVKPRNQDDTRWITDDQKRLKQSIILVLNLIMAPDLSLVIMICSRKMIFLLI